MDPTAQAKPLSALPTTIERRFYPRIVPLAPMYILINDANQCLVINVSENGLLLSTRTGLPCNSVARVALPLDGLPKPVVLNIRVLWTSEIRRLAGIQILDVSDLDRQQIRKWGNYVWSTSFDRDVQREPQHKPDQLRIVEPFPKTTGKTKAESPSAPKLPLNNSAVAPSPSTSPSPSGIREQSPSASTPITRWIMFLVALGVVGAFIFRSGAMEHSFLRSATTPRTNATVPPPTQDGHSDLRSSDSTEGIGNRDADWPSQRTNAANSKNVLSTATGLENSQPAEAQRDREQKLSLPLNTTQNARKAPRAASSFPATRTIERNFSANQSRTKSKGAASSTKDITSGVAPPAGAFVAPNSSSVAAGSSSSAPANAAITPAISPSPAVTASSSNSTHSNDVAPSAPEPVASRSNVAPVSSANPRNSAAPVAQPIIQMDPPARQVLEVHLPSGYRAPFFNVPNETVLESSSATIRIQRSVRLPSGSSHWPLHRKTRIVVGGLISRVDPQFTQLPTGSREDVRVHATVADDGQVKSVRPIYGPANLFPTVLTAVQGWRYQPTLIDGKPVETQADVLVQLHASPPRSALR
jgi:hypothetical protein